MFVTNTLHVSNILASITVNASKLLSSKNQNLGFFYFVFNFIYFHFFEGFIGNGIECVELNFATTNECESGTHNCDENAICTDIDQG